MKKINRFQNSMIRLFGVDRYYAQMEHNKSLDRLKQDANVEYVLLENKKWYEGQSHSLEMFYKHSLPFMYNINNNSFWRAVNSKMVRLHYPMPKTISNAMGTLLFSQTPEFRVDSGSKVRDEKFQSRLDHILDINDIAVKLNESAAIQSYSGQVGFKLNWAPEIIDVPLITVYPKEQIEIHKKFGQIIYIDFIDDLDADHKLVSRYGRGYINYMLFKNGKQVSLGAHPETANLQDLGFFDSSEQLIPIIFAAVIDNKGNGASDYAGLIDTFHAIDETYSSMVEYIRKSKIKTFITEDLAPKDHLGNMLPFSDFDSTVTVLDESMTGDGGRNSKIDREVVNLQIKGYKDMLDKLRNVALETIGVSAATLGIESGGASASGEALNIRERASARLRTEKLENWYEGMNEFLYALLVFDYIMHNNQEIREGILVSEPIAPFKVISLFGEYYKETIADRSTTYLKLYEAGLIPHDFALIQIFGGELSEVELKTLIDSFKKEEEGEEG